MLLHVLVCDIVSVHVVCFPSICSFNNNNNLYLTLAFMPVHFGCDYIRYTCYRAHLPVLSSLMSALAKERELRTSEEIGDVYDCTFLSNTYCRIFW